MKIPKKINRKLIGGEIILFTIMYIFIVYILHFFVYSHLAIPFYGVAGVIYIFFIIPSSINKKKSNLFAFFNHFKYKKRSLNKFQKHKYIYASQLEIWINDKRRRKV